MTTDKSDYSFGETALIAGSGFQIGEAVELQVTHAEGTEGSNADPQNQAWTVIDGGAGDLDNLADGNINATWVVDDPDARLATYTLTAAGLTSGELALATFTDTALVNTTTPDPQQIHFETPRAVAFDSSGNHVVVWSGNGSGDSLGVFAQRYSPAGVKIGGEVRVNTTTTNVQQFPTISMAENGDFVVAWSSTDGNGWDIRARRFTYDGSGNILAHTPADFRVTTASSSTSGDQHFASVAMEDDGAFVVVWHDAAQTDITFQRYNADGTLAGVATDVTTSNSAAEPSVAMADDGSFVVAWRQGSTSILAQRYLANGTANGLAIPVASSNFRTSDNFPSVAMDAAGNFAVIWRHSNSNQIRFQRYNAAGVAQDVTKNVMADGGFEIKYAALSMNAEGSFAVSWWENTGNKAVKVKEYSAGGVELRAITVFNNSSHTGDKFTSVGLDDDGRLVVVWSGQGPGDSSGVFYDFFAPIAPVNTAPTVAANNPSVSVNEGQSALNTGTYSDSNAGDNVTITASVGTITKTGTNSGTWNWSYATTDGPNQSQTVTITANDGNGGATTTTFALTVNNVVPTIAISGAATVTEGSAYSLTLGAVSDPGSDTVTSYIVHWGDGDSDTYTTIGAKAHTYDDGPNTYNITVDLVDEDGTHLNRANAFSVVVNNAAPTVAADSATVTVNEGDSANNTGTFDDVGDDTIILSASVGTVIDNNDGTWSWSFGTTDGPDDSQTVTITATDSDGEATSTTFALTVNNVAPTIAADDATVTVNEGQTASNTGTFDDVGDDTITLSASVGTVIDNNDGTWSWSFGTTDGPDDSQTVTITATDSDGEATSTTFALTVNNVAPTIAADDATVTVNEGASATNTGTFADVGDDTIIISASVGIVTDNLDGTWSWSLGTADGPDDSQTVTITATDSDGESTSTTFALTVNNVAPTITANNATVTVNEGQTASNTGTFDDVGDDTITLSASVGTVTDNNDGTWSWSFGTTDGPDDSQTVTITATDSDGQSSSTTFALTVNNVAPTIAADNATVTVNEGQTANNSGSFDDVGDNTITLSASVGTVTDNGDGTWSWSFGTTNGPDDSQTVTITATDSDDEYTETTFALVVNNVAPSVAADDATVTVNEDQTANNSGTYADPGADTITLSASVGTVTDNGDGIWSWSFGTTDGPDDSQTVTITATDSDGEFTTTTFSLVVNNVAPTLSISGASSVNEGSGYTLNLSSSDPGQDTITSWTIDWGDGSAPQVVNGNPSSVSYTYADGPASYTITVTATDDDGTYSANGVGVAVNNVAPTATGNAYTLNEDTTISGNVISDNTGSGVDSDPAGAADPLIIWAVNGSAAGVGVAVSTAHGSVTVNADGTFSYTPDAHYFGSDSFTYTISDGDGGESTATVQLTINEVNDAPAASNDTASTGQDTAVSGDVLGNDTDPDNTDGLPGNDDDLDAVLVTGPSHGTLTFDPETGAFTYMPSLGYSGLDTFTYDAVDQDGAQSNLATVTINVAPAGPGTIYTRPDPCLGGTMLIINGSNADDQIHVSPTGDGGLLVNINGVSKGIYYVTGRIVVFGFDGNDQITVAGAMPNVAWLYGDNGEDLLNLGNGGGIAWGGNGSDHINGGSGSDILIGGQGGDRIVGNPGDDVLVAGLTDYDDRFSATSNHEDAWCHIYKEWSRKDLTTTSTTGDSSYTAFEQKVDHLKGPSAGGTSGGHNGAFYLNNSTVADDDSFDQIDMLTGAAGEDWFLWTKGEDKVTGMSGSEGLEDLDTIT